jgi:ketosteroid isomerase-like protein
MSQENVEIVRRAHEATLRQPKPDFDTINALYHRDHELLSVQERLEGGVRRGAQGYRGWLAEVAESWESWDAAVKHVESIDDDRVLVDLAWTGIGRRSGVRLEQSQFWIVTVRGEKIVRSEIFSSREEALEAAGLRD